MDHFNSSYYLKCVFRPIDGGKPAIFVRRFDDMKSMDDYFCSFEFDRQFCYSCSFFRCPCVVNISLNSPFDCRSVDLFEDLPLDF